MSPEQIWRRHPGSWLLAVLGLWMAAPSVLATIARPTDFATMVRTADVIFQGKAVAERPEWAVLNGRRAIVTFVSFEVEETFKGAIPRTLELRLPGGTIGDKRFEMVDFPRVVGEKVVLFVRTNENRISPLVGVYHGKLTIKKDSTSGEEILVRHNGKPLTALEEIGKVEDEPQAGAGTAAPNAAAISLPPMNIRQFRQSLRKQVEAGTRQ